ncbi:sugar ABC transporter substrate-binding protein, partial [Pseudomonas aeruginosa]
MDSKHCKRRLAPNNKKKVFLMNAIRRLSAVICLSSLCLSPLLAQAGEVEVLHWWTS